MKLIFYKLYLTLVCIIALSISIGWPLDEISSYNYKQTRYENASRYPTDTCLDYNGEKKVGDNYGLCEFQKDFPEPSVLFLIIKIIGIITITFASSLLLIHWYSWVFKVNLKSE